jgi:hypothetical protein
MGEMLEARALARAKVRARRKRITLIRRRSLWFSAAVFAALWAVIFAQLVGGHDPALASKKARPVRAIVHRPVHARRRLRRRHHKRHHHPHHHSHPAAAPAPAPAPTPAPAPVTTQQS